MLKRLTQFEVAFALFLSGIVICLFVGLRVGILAGEHREKTRQKATADAESQMETLRADQLETLRELIEALEGEDAK